MYGGGRRIYGGAGRNSLLTCTLQLTTTQLPYHWTREVLFSFNSNLQGQWCHFKIYDDTDRKNRGAWRNYGCSMILFYLKTAVFRGLFLSSPIVVYPNGNLQKIKLSPFHHHPVIYLLCYEWMNFLFFFGFCNLEISYLLLYMYNLRWIQEKYILNFVM